MNIETELIFNQYFRIIYFVLSFVVAFFLLEQYAKGNFHRKMQNIFLLVFFIIFILLFGNRGVNVGIDTKNTISYFTGDRIISSVSEVKDVGVFLCNFVYPSPAIWLRGFQDAQFVLTDSFHGTVFSILHNIPFVAFGNVQRGMSRFKSLLTMFGLQDRLITDFASFDADQLIAKKIDWASVNNILEVERKKAVRFLKENLFLG